jgi:hypothetical protein
MAKDQLKEHIERIVSKTNYVLESPSYKAIIDDDYSSYDDPNKFMGGPDPVNGNSPLREEDPLPDEEVPAPEPEMGGEEEAIPSPVAGEPAEEPVGDVPAEPVVGQAADEPLAEPQQTPDQLQNDIIKQNIDVMRQLNSKIEDLESGIDQLNMQNNQLVAKSMEMEKEVEEVREPTNVEKLMSRKEDSHPYYYGLNDMWKGNWFQARRDEEQERGLKQMDDGSYVADFDSMPQFNDQEIKDSFDK